MVLIGEAGRRCRTDRIDAWNRCLANSRTNLLSERSEVFSSAESAPIPTLNESVQLTAVSVDTRRSINSSQFFYQTFFYFAFGSWNLESGIRQRWSEHMREELGDVQNGRCLPTPSDVDGALLLVRLVCVVVKLEDLIQR